MYLRQTFLHCIALHCISIFSYKYIVHNNRGWFYPRLNIIMRITIITCSSSKSIALEVNHNRPPFGCWELVKFPIVSVLVQRKRKKKKHGMMYDVNFSDDIGYNYWWNWREKKAFCCHSSRPLHFWNNYILHRITLWYTYQALWPTYTTSNFRNLPISALYEQRFDIDHPKYSVITVMK